VAASGQARAQELIAHGASGKTAFVGVGAAFVEDLRQWTDAGAEVLYEPTADTAHANLVLTTKTKADIGYDAKRELSKRLTPVTADALAYLHSTLAVRRSKRAAEYITKDVFGRRSSGRMRAPSS
jgi:hypothetical protein